MVTKSGRVFGSVIFEEYGSDELSLNFFTADMPRMKDTKEEMLAEDKVLDYPQSPCDQTWMVDYPLLAYKSPTPMNKEIAIVHLALNMPQRIIHLGEWEFVCFVNHTQMVEQKLFKREKETNCDIFFLVRREEKIRLMSFKSNPWLDFAEEPSEADEDIYKQSIFLFNGSFTMMPTEDSQGNKFDWNEQERNDSLKRYSRRFNSDKVQNVQLISKTLGSFEHATLILQFNDSIVQVSLNKK